MQLAHNNKEVSLAAISTGAYDSSTWGFDLDRPGVYTDDPQRLPGAKFFLPTIDEYTKAVHYDPNRSGPGLGGYWDYGNFSDAPPTPGAPGEGQTNAGYRPEGNPHAAWNIPLGAYPDVHSYYGLLDTNGGGTERIEGDPGRSPGRTRGAYAGSTLATLELNGYIGFFGGTSPPSSAGPTSFRIYSVPNPGTAFVLMGWLGYMGASRSRRLGHWHTRRRRRYQRPALLPGTLRDGVLRGPHRMTGSRGRDRPDACPTRSRGSFCEEFKAECVPQKPSPGPLAGIFRARASSLCEVGALGPHGVGMTQLASEAPCFR